MRHKKLLILLLVLFSVNAARAQLFKIVDVGKMEARIYDHGCQSEDVRDHGMVTYYRGSMVTMGEISNMWPGGLLKNAGMFFGARNWTDTTGYTWDAYITGHAARKRGDETYQYALTDEDGYYIRKYMRYPIPQIIVDGVHLEGPMMSGDEVAPEKIWGTADMMIESNIRLSIGVDVKQRVLAWSQPGHDDYIIWDWTFVNTGNADIDPEIELPGQALEDVYITRVIEALINGTTANKVFPTWAGTTEDHDTRLSYPQDDDSLRIDYVTPLRAADAGYDSYGKKPNAEMTLLDGARFGGTAVLFAPKACNVPQSYPISNIAASNDPAQPSMHSSLLTEPSWIIWDFPGLDSADYYSAYQRMAMGGFGILDSSDLFFQDVYYMDSVYDVYDTTASGVKTHYEQPLDRWGELESKGLEYVYAGDIGYMRFDQQCHFSVGPYHMEFGDTLRYVYAYVGGAISRKHSYLGGEAWNSGEATSYSWLAELDSAQMVDELSKRDPIFNRFYNIDPGITPIPLLNDIAKDLLVATGRDSLFENGMNAQRNFNMNYNVPASPNPPSIFEISSLSDMIKLEWTYEGGAPSNLAGFKIYRAAGGHIFEKAAEIILGDWQLHDSVGPEARSYGDTEDKGITPGSDYFYALTAVSDQGVESGRFLTMTTQPARLKSVAASSLDSVLVVPNPLNISNDALGRYPEGEGHKLNFVNLTDDCTITILTESGKLVTTIKHIGGGIASWYDGQRYMFTDADQRPVSGIYIAHIQDNITGQCVSRKFVIVR